MVNKTYFYGISHLNTTGDINKHLTTGATPAVYTYASTKKVDVGSFVLVQNYNGLVTGVVVSEVTEAAAAEVATKFNIKQWKFIAADVTLTPLYKLTLESHEQEIDPETVGFYITVPTPKASALKSCLLGEDLPTYLFASNEEHQEGDVVLLPMHDGVQAGVIVQRIMNERSLKACREEEGYFIIASATLHPWYLPLLMKNTSWKPAQTDFKKGL